MALGARPTDKSRGRSYASRLLPGLLHTTRRPQPAAATERQGHARHGIGRHQAQRIDQRLQVWLIHPPEFLALVRQPLNSLGSAVRSVDRPLWRGDHPRRLARWRATSVELPQFCVLIALL